MSEWPRLPPGPPFVMRFLGDPILTTPATPVPVGIPLEDGLLAAMTRELSRAGGLGLAAQQVGSLSRVCLVVLKEKPKEAALLVNPRITARSPETVLCSREGCLSVPGFRTNVRRHIWIDAEFVGPDGALTRRRFEGQDAQVVQHECDHLDGHCIVAGLSRQQRRQSERAVRQWFAAQRSRA
jgi:peptide deformylase